MARQEKETVSYETTLRDGLRESNVFGVIVDDGKDEPYRVRLVKKTSVEVVDGRGKNWDASRNVYEDIVDLTLEQAANLAKSIVNDLAYAAVVAERRVLIPEPEEQA